MNIVLLSDGTGNSSAKLFRTNVWRLYEALDLRPGSNQVACYDNGVGTASFKPLAVLGGAFGFGLKRNLLDLYTFLCQIYKPGDRIYAFGFSRGAFTIRLLLQLIRYEGIIVGEHGADLERFARWAYRRFRRRFNQTKGLVALIRWVRDTGFEFIDFARRKRPYAKVERLQADIEFAGLWDTVDAYGLPVAELTDGWDRWIWPLTMPTSMPNPRIRKAYHALALDDERQTFHPLLWDERGERQNLTSTHLNQERISQVWFAGMHSNVGGGYPDDGMSYEPLHWIAREAQRLGLRLRPVPLFPGGNMLDAWRAQAVPSAPINDSRAGVAAYYRYQPRDVRRLSRDPKRAIVIPRPKIHESVFDRLRCEAASYEPIVLPQDYVVVRDDGRIEDQTTYGVEPPAQAAIRFSSQEIAWNLVWLRRIVYFATVAASLWLISLPFLPEDSTKQMLNSALPSWSVALGMAGNILPGFAATWIKYFQRYPVQLIVFGGLVAALLTYGAGLRRRIEDRMFEMWRASGPAPISPFQALVMRFRTSGAYRAVFQFLRYAVVPNVFGLLILAAFVDIGASVVTNLIVSVNSLDGRLCGNVAILNGGPSHSWSVQFPNNDVCYPTGILLDTNSTYEIEFNLPLQSEHQWWDRDHPVTSVRGFGTDRWAFLVGLPFRRHLGLPWFTPVARVGNTGAEYYPLNEPVAPTDLRRSVTWIKPRRKGQLFLYVNDAFPPWICAPAGTRSRTLTLTCFYENNVGAPAQVIVTMK